MTRPSVTLETLTGFNEAVEVNNSNVVLPVGAATDIPNGAFGTLRLSEIENDARYRRVYSLDSALGGPFAGQECGVGANVGPTLYTTALVNDTKFQGGELVLSTAIPDGSFREIGVGVDNSGLSGFDVPFADTLIGTSLFNCTGTVWDATRSVLKVQDGVYHLGLSLYVRGGGQGLIRVRIVGPDGTEVLRAMDCLGGDGVYTAGSRYTDWGCGSHTVTKMSGEYTLYVLLNTTETPTGFMTIVNVAGITPSDPNAVFPSA